MIQVNNLCKKFGPNKAVDQVSFEVSKGEVLGFLGPNGAGKSTTMRMLTCFLPPTSGTANICGHDIWKNPIEVRKSLGYLPESAPSYNEMLVEEFLEFSGAIRGFSGKELTIKVEKVIELASLKDVRVQIIETLSKGYRQRTCLAQALIHDPPVLILDEPTDGLDPNQKQEVRDLIKQMSEKRAILVSTHILEEVEAICDRAIIIANGKIVADATPNELLEKSVYHNSIGITLISNDRENLFNQLQELPDVASVDMTDGDNDEKVNFQIFPAEGQTILRTVENFIHDNKLIVERMYVDRGRLDEVFRKLTLNI